MTTDIPDWIADAHRDDGKRFVARAHEKLTAFVELESAILRLREFTWQIFGALPKRNVDSMTKTG
jgi:hypothetical protein